MFGALLSKSQTALAAHARPNPSDLILTGAGCGLVQGTLVATPDGWVTVETLQVGDEMLTFDAGVQSVVAMVHDAAWQADKLSPRKLWPLRVPAGTLDNTHDMMVLPHQGVLVESDDVCDRWGDPYAVVPGAALAVLPGVEPVQPIGSAMVVMPVFAEDQMVFAGGGLLMFCQAHWGVSAGILPKFGAAFNYNMLPIGAAKVMLEMALVSDKMPVLCGRD